MVRVYSKTHSMKFMLRHFMHDSLKKTLKNVAKIYFCGCSKNESTTRISIN